MKSAKHGSATSGAEVVHVSSHGFWVFLEARNCELYLSFREFPWFAEASIRELSLIEVERDRMLRWPELDVDLDVDRIDHPERYPLVARHPRKRVARRAPSTTKRAAPAKTRRADRKGKRVAGGGRPAR